MPGNPADGVESDIDRIIREAIEAGEFDDLPGTGRPLPGAGTSDDEYWWVREWLKRNLADREATEEKPEAPDAE